MEEKHIVIIDWSMICQGRLYSLLSGAEPLTRASDIEEVKYRMAKDVFKILDKLKPTNVILAKDYKINGVRQYWREEYLADYHMKNTELYKSESTGESYYRYDNVIYPCLSLEGDVAILGKKLTKKNTPKDLELVEDWDREVIKSFAPQYKGNRSNTDWVFMTPKSEFTKLFDQVAIDLTNIIPNCKILEAEGAEADDIAGVLTRKAPNIPHTLVTGDGDWNQLAENPNVDIMHHINFELLETNAEDVKFDLRVKCVAGDSGDNIKGTYVEGQSGCLGAVKALKIVSEGKEDTLYEPSFKRNKKLIVLDLDTIPITIQNNILTDLKESKPSNEECSWEKLGLNQREQQILTQTGNIFTQKY